MSEQQLVLMRMPLGPLGTNCYVIGDKAIGEAFIIDPAYLYLKYIIKL